MKFVTECAADITAKVQTVPSLTKKTVTIYNIDDFVGMMKHAVKPAAGLLYEGARKGNSESGKQLTVSGEIVFSLMILTETNTLNQTTDFMSPAHLLLDAVREAVHGTRAPTGHYWAWQMEAPVKSVNNLTVWAQRWSCQVQLPPPARN